MRTPHFFDIGSLTRARPGAPSFFFFWHPPQRVQCIPERTGPFLQTGSCPRGKALHPATSRRALRCRSNGIGPLANRQGHGGGLTIHQESDVYGARLAVGSAVRHTLRHGRIGWVQVALGEVIRNGFPLAAGDGAVIEAQRTELRMEATTQAEILLFDMIR